jgi:cytochrome c-type biogenesis protein CcmF
LTRNRRRYGGYVVHLGVVLIVIGFVGSAFKTERHAEVKPGGSLRVAGYELDYERLERDSTPEKRIFAATMTVHRGGEEIATIYPQRNFHIAQRQWQSEVAIRSTPVEDLYVVITSFSPDGSASVRAFVNPLTWWIWVGAAVMASGMIFIMAGAAPVTVPVDARRSVREVAVATR